MVESRRECGIRRRENLQMKEKKKKRRKKNRSIISTILRSFTSYLLVFVGCRVSIDEKAPGRNFLGQERHVLKVGHTISEGVNSAHTKKLIG